MHEALMGLGAISQAEVQGNASWDLLLRQLAKNGRALRLADEKLWLARERLGLLQSVYPDAVLEPALQMLPGFDQAPEPDLALTELLRARLSGHGPSTAPQIAAPLGKPLPAVEQALARLEAEGYVLRGHFSLVQPTCSGANAICWRAFIATP